MIAPHRGSEVSTVVRATNNDGIVIGLRVKAVYKIDIALVVDALKQRAIGALDLELIPWHINITWMM